jgi:hypothetical protein
MTIHGSEPPCLYLDAFQRALTTDPLADSDEEMDRPDDADSRRMDHIDRSKRLTLPPSRYDLQSRVPRSPQIVCHFEIAGAVGDSRIGNLCADHFTLHPSSSEPQSCPFRAFFLHLQVAGNLSHRPPTPSIL